MEDQKRIADQISQNTSVIAPATSSGSKKGKRKAVDTNAKMTDAASKDFGIENAVSSRAECRGCEIKIMKGEVRIKKTVYDTEIGMKFGGQATWYNYECFAKVDDFILLLSLISHCEIDNHVCVDREKKAILMKIILF